VRNLKVELGKMS
jgi:hypothetical protein